MTHERLTLADELDAAMIDAPELCAQCGTPLADDEPYLCDDCTARALRYPDDDDGPSDDDWARVAEDIGTRFYRSGLGVLALACLVATLIGTAGLERVRAQDTTLRAPHAFNGRIYQWPAIGTLQYSRSCGIVRFWEDFSAVAYCAEDGALYRYLPQGQPYANTAGNPILAPGWYPVSATR